MNRRIPCAAPLAVLLPVLLPALLLTACGGLLTSEQPARQNYLLRPYEAAAQPVDGAAKPDMALSLSVVPGLDTDRLQALGVDARLNYYANARWPDHLPEVLSSVIGRSLESTGQFATVGVAASGAAGAWALDLEVREFYGIQNAAGATSSVRVAISGRLICGGPPHEVRLAESAPVAEERLAVVVAAHQAALDSVTRELNGRIQALCAAAEGG